jgi:hypothetical protein
MIDGDWGHGTYEKHLLWMSHHGNYCSDLRSLRIVVVTAHHESEYAACGADSTALSLIGISTK